MFRFTASVLGAGALIVVAGCPFEDPGVSAPVVDDFVLGQTAAQSDSADSDIPADAPADSDGERFDTLTASGRVRGSGAYELFELGASDAGDRWTLAPVSGTSGVFVIGLFDSSQNLLLRGYVSGTAISLEHVMRWSTDRLLLGVMTPAGGGGGDFNIRATREPGAEIPPPAAQIVYLNFAGGADVSVHAETPLSFAAFDGGAISDLYVDDAVSIKDAIVAVMRADYASYNVTFVTSDEGAPGEPHTTVHFGGHDAALLGLADAVDAYNREPVEQAIIYVESFGIYETMRLSAEQMGVMIGNVASHELGHLLGLYHTRNPDDIMDTTGTAWELSESQDFMRAPLEPGVFVIGSEDSPRVLSHSVGMRPDAAKLGPPQRVRAIPLEGVIRRFAAAEARHSCGTCLRLDEPR